VTYLPVIPIVGPDRCAWCLSKRVGTRCVRCDIVAGVTRIPGPGITEPAPATPGVEDDA